MACRACFREAVQGSFMHGSMAPGATPGPHLPPLCSTTCLRCWRWRGWRGSAPAMHGGDPPTWNGGTARTRAPLCECGSWPSVIFIERCCLCVLLGLEKCRSAGLPVRNAVHSASSLLSSEGLLAACRPGDVNTTLIARARGEEGWPHCQTAAARSEAAERFLGIEDLLGEHDRCASRGGGVAQAVVCTAAIRLMVWWRRACVMTRQPTHPRFQGPDVCAAGDAAHPALRPPSGACLPPHCPEVRRQCL